MNLMQHLVVEIVRQRGLQPAFNQSAEFHLRLDNPPYLPLVIERQGLIISVAHYGELNGDAIRDPELTFRWPDWVPTSITQDPVGRYAEALSVVDGRTMVRPRLLRDLRSFANTWARNLRHQGFANPAIRASSLTHAGLLQPTP